MPYGYAGPVGAAEEPSPSGESGWLEDVIRAQKLVELLNNQLGGQERPEPLQLPRAEMPNLPGMTPYEELPKWRKGTEKGLDVAMLVATALANRKARKSGAPLLSTSSLPLISRERAQQESTRAALEAQTADKNRSIATDEAKFNRGMMEDWTQRRASRINSMLPSILSGVMREGKAPEEKEIDAKMRLLQRSEAWKAASPKERAEMETNMLGAYTRGGGRDTPEDAYHKAYSRVLAGIHARKFAGVSPSGSGGVDIAERDVQDAARLMMKYMYEDGYDEDEAYRMTMEYLRAKHRMRGDVKAGGPAPAPKKYGFRADRQGVTDPTLQRKVEIYAAQISEHPERREMLRQRILREHGIDPDALIEETR